MVKPGENLCKRALQNGVAECNGADLLAECTILSRTLNIANVSEGHHDKCTIRNAIRNKKQQENNRDLKTYIFQKHIDMTKEHDHIVFWI